MRDAALIKPSQTQVRRLLTFLKDQSKDLRPAVRWLMLGRRMAESLEAKELAQKPSLDQLLQLMRLLKRERSDLIDTATLLMASSPYAEQLYVEVQLDVLVDWDPDTWGHPVQLLIRPRSPWPVLLAACRQRLANNQDVASRKRLRSVEVKLERAVELQEQARRRLRNRRAAQLKKASKNAGRL